MGVAKQSDKETGLKLLKEERFAGLDEDQGKKKRSVMDASNKLLTILCFSCRVALYWIPIWIG